MTKIAIYNSEGDPILQAAAVGAALTEKVPKKVHQSRSVNLSKPYDKLRDHEKLENFNETYAIRLLSELCAVFLEPTILKKIQDEAPEKGNRTLNPLQEPELW